jgi:hypothetical protein
LEEQLQNRTNPTKSVRKIAHPRQINSVGFDGIFGLPEFAAGQASKEQQRARRPAQKAGSTPLEMGRVGDK